MQFSGLTGPIQFDRDGLRTNFTLSVSELSEQGLTRVGHWTPSHGVKYSLGDRMTEIERSLRNKTLVVITTVVSSRRAPAAVTRVHGSGGLRIFGVVTRDKIPNGMRLLLLTFGDNALQ